MARPTSPPTMRPIPSPSSHGTLAPTDASTLTPGAASAFITTTAHWPERGSPLDGLLAVAGGRGHPDVRCPGGSGRRSPLE